MLEGKDKVSEMENSDINRRAIAWIAGSDTGGSSKSIWSVMMGVEFEYPNPPYDPADFGRCYRLLLKIPEWKPHLHLVAEKYPEWRLLIEHWGELENLYLKECASGEAPKLYKRMHELSDQYYAEKRGKGRG